MQTLIDSHEKNTAATVETVIADSNYGTLDNYVACKDQDIKAHISCLEQHQKGTGRQKDIFGREMFIHDYAKDIFICPADQILKNRFRQHPGE
jgi:hypothetical protein